MTCLAVYLTRKKRKKNRHGNFTCGTYILSLWKTKFNIIRPWTGIRLKQFLSKSVYLLLIQLPLPLLLFWHRSIRICPDRIVTITSKVRKGDFLSIYLCQPDKEYLTYQVTCLGETLGGGEGHTLWPEYALSQRVCPAEKFVVHRAESSKEKLFFLIKSEKPWEKPGFWKAWKTFLITRNVWTNVTPN